MEQNPPSSAHGQGQQRTQPQYDTNHGGHYGKWPESLANTLFCSLESGVKSLANHCLLQVPALQYVPRERPQPGVDLLTRIACGSRICTRCGILHWSLGKCTNPTVWTIIFGLELMNPGQPRPPRYLQGHPDHLLAARNQPPRIRNPRLQAASAPPSPHQESHESGSGSEDDLGRSTNPVR